jgi:vacuolar-type H+-ATPase subunit E/Vma4
MEELKSIETLNREILDDARKKAHEILKAADNALQVQAKEWEEKLKADLDSAKKGSAERIKKTQERIFARLPLDKRRLRSETFEGFLLKAMDDFLGSLSREELLSILEMDLARRLKDWAGKDEKAISFAKDSNLSIEVRYSGLSVSEAQNILKRVSLTGNLKMHEDKTVHKLPSIEISTEAMKIRVSVRTLSAFLLKSKRAELAAALMGEGVLDD